MMSFLHKLLLVSAAVVVVVVRGHGTIVSPAAYSSGEYVAQTPDMACEGLSCYVFANYTFGVGSPTLGRDSDFRTWQDWGVDGDVTASHPWRAPGTAGVFASGCGVFGGNPRGCDGVPLEQGVPPTQCNGAGSALGVDGASLESQGSVTRWTRGKTVDIKFGITANHGGGYAYRLCKRPDGAEADSMWQTEACFQAGSLDFASDDQFAEYADGSRVGPWPAKRLSEGTWPEGSTWTVNPIPANGGLSGQEPNATQFPPPHPSSPVGFGPFYNVSIVDSVVIPSDLALGRYALSWRWDCEQTSQVWLSCAAIDVVDDDAEEVAGVSVTTTTQPGRRCGTPRGACGIDCTDAGDPTSCLAFAGSGIFTIQRSVCEGLAAEGDDDDDTNFTWFDAPNGVCDEEYLCGLACDDDTAFDYEVCTLFFNNLQPIGRSKPVCDLVNGTWLRADGAPVAQNTEFYTPTDEARRVVKDNVKEVARVASSVVDRVRAAIHAIHH